MEAASILWRPIGELFVARRLITEEQLEQALAEQAATGQRLGETLVKQNLITSPELTQALMEQLGREVAKEDGFGSGLWAEIQRRNSRDDNPSELSVVEANRSPFGSALGEAVANTAEEPSTVNLSQAELEHQGSDHADSALEASAFGTPADLEAISRELAAKETMVASLTSELEQARERLAAREEMFAQEIEARQSARSDAELLRKHLAERENRLTEIEAEVASLTLASEHEAAAHPAPDEHMERELVVRAARLSELEQTLEVREGRIEELERLSEEPRRERDGTNDRLTHAESRAVEAEGQLLGLEQQLQVAEGRVSELGGQVTALRTQLETADASLQHEREEHEQARQRVEQLVAETAGPSAALAESERALETVRGERDRALSELDQARRATNEVELVRAEAADERRGAGELRERLLIAEERAGELDRGAGDLADQLAAARAELQGSHAVAVDLEQRLTMAGSRAVELEMQVDALGERLAIGESALADERDAHDSTRKLAEAARAGLDETAAKLQEVEALSAELAFAVEGVAEERSQLAAKANRDQREADLRLAALDARLAEETSSHAETRRVLAQALDELAVESVPGVSGEGESALQDYLCFAPGKEGYRLVHGSGRVPAIGDPYDLDGAEHLVTRIGRSPLPFDSRRCVYLQAS